MWTTRTSATSSHTEKRRRRSKSFKSSVKTSVQTHTRPATYSLPPLQRDGSLAHTRALAPSFRSPSSMQKDLSPSWGCSVRGRKAVGVFVCEYQQGNMGLFSIKIIL